MGHLHSKQLRALTHKTRRQQSLYQAVWNDVVLAESDETISVEGNQYFPTEPLNSAYFSREEISRQ
ncbi:DUF427 domain-containing protein [Cryobacterium gelidum]|uniref:DUF427 domain-containing protein n=1 Tax=Cryobacterium gelidum TaxID=1259164 RepID=UPI0030B9D07E